jgi:hypothetical protein
VKELSGKLLFLRFDFFPTSRWHKTTPREGLVFFVFCWICYVRSETRMKWQRMTSPARGQIVQNPALTVDV